MDEQQPRRRRVVIWAGGVLVTLFVGILVVEYGQLRYPPDPGPPTVVPITVPSEGPSLLEIYSADLSRHSRRQYILGFLPIGTDRITDYDIVTVNRTAGALSDCEMI